MDLHGRYWRSLPTKGVIGLGIGYVAGTPQSHIPVVDSRDYLESEGDSSEKLEETEEESITLDTEDRDSWELSDPYDSDGNMSQSYGSTRGT